jgi:hypothetical protein
VVLAIFWRRPDALLNPQFYAEDGAFWYAQAWNLGWLHSLILPEGGYLNTLPRLVCGLAILFPLKSGPLLLNWFGILIQTLPVAVLLSPRCANWGPLWMRSVQAALYVALPNSGELNVTMTNAHWHLALAACFLVFGNTPTCRAWKLFDIVLLILVGLTGPWALVLTPLVLVFWWIRRQRWSLVTAGLLFVCAAIQAAELLFSAGGYARPSTPLGATIPLFIRLLASQIYAGAIWGENLLDIRGSMLELALIFVAGTAVLAWGLIKLRLEMKLFTIFALLILAAALQSPLVFGDQPRWYALATDKGARYWFFPMLALVWTLLWAASQRHQRALQIFSFVCLAVMTRGIRHDWHYWAYKDLNFGYYVRQFELAAPDSRIGIPIVPVGHIMVLVKK